MAVAGAGSPLTRSCAALASPFIAVAPQGRVQFRFKQLLDEAADPAANSSFQGIEPVIAKKTPPSEGPTAVFVLSVVMA